MNLQILGMRNFLATRLVLDGINRMKKQAGDFHQHFRKC